MQDSMGQQRLIWAPLSAVLGGSERIGASLTWLLVMYGCKSHRVSPSCGSSSVGRDANQFVNGKANSTSVIEGQKRLLFLSPSGIQHVLSRHRDRYAPGSLFNQNVDFDSLISSFIDTDPDEVGGNGFVKWLGKDVGTIVGSMGVKKGTAEEVANMRDYQMPDSRMPEKVKVAAGERTPTSEISLIIAPMGKLSDGREVFSLVTMFPGGTVVDGQELPMNRNEFADLGLYFVLPEDSPML